MNSVAKLAHRKSRWKLRKIIAQSNSTKEGTEDSERKIIAIGRIEVTSCGKIAHQENLEKKPLRNAQANHLFRVSQLQSDSLEFSMYQTRGQTFGTR